MTPMIQLLGLRSFTNAEGNETTYDAFFERNWRAESIPSLFKLIDMTVAAIPESERYNLFYTLAHCGEKRQFISQNVLAWDIDGLDGLTTEQKNDYIPVVCEALQIEQSSVFVVDSGNGLHFLIELKNKIESPDFFREHREGYKKTCAAIDAALATKKLVGKADPAIFEPRRLLRLPNTRNRKPNKPMTACQVFKSSNALGSFCPVNFTLEKTRKNAKDWGAANKLLEEKKREKELKRLEKLHAVQTYKEQRETEKLQTKEQREAEKLQTKEQREAEKLAKEEEKQLLKELEREEKRAKILASVRPDNNAILGGCKFLQWARVHQNKVTEPEWYAALSIVGRMEDGRKLAHEFSDQHPTYTPSGTDAKLEQSLTASGPRTCENIHEIWKGDDGKGCEGCPYHKSDIVASPISIQSPDFVATEHNGFYKAVMTSNGGVKNIPDYEGLRRYFQRATSYKVLNPSRIVYTWAGTHYQDISKVAIEAYAQEHFSPQADTKMVTEFRLLTERHNLHQIDWFTTKQHGRMNFLNGVLDIGSGAFTPSDKELGFRHVLPYEYDAGATCPTFDKMLAKITCNDPQLESVLLQFIGYCLSGDSYWCHKALVLVGDGSNGKSTLLNVIKMLAGNANYSAMQLGDFTSEYNRQVLDGKLFNLSEETSYKAFNDTSTFKALIGGVGLQVRAPYGLPYTITNSAKMILTCNELPKNWDQSSGMERRLLIVPFNHTFSKSDPDYDPFVDEKLRGELAGILNRAVEAYKLLIESKYFSEAAASKQAQDSYLLENNTVKLWANDELYSDGVDEKEYIKLSDLFSSYKLFCDKFNHRPVSHRMFFKQLSKIVPNYDNKTKKLKIDRKTSFVIYGYKCESEMGAGFN